jgi:hypothetical protein
MIKFAGRHDLLLTVLKDFLGQRRSVEREAKLGGRSGRTWALIKLANQMRGRPLDE